MKYPTGTRRLLSRELGEKWSRYNWSSILFVLSILQRSRTQHFSTFPMCSCSLYSTPSPAPVAKTLLPLLVRCWHSRYPIQEHPLWTKNFPMTSASFTWNVERCILDVWKSKSLFIPKGLEQPERCVCVFHYHDYTFALGFTSACPRKIASFYVLQR